MRRGIALRLGPLTLIALSLAACLSVGPREEAALVWYQVQPPPPEPAGTAVDLTISLRPFSQDGPLDSEEIRYVASDVESGYWANRLWSEPVSGMVRGALQRDLEAWGGFSRVLLLDNAGLADVLVTGVVHRFEEVDRAEGWSAVVEASFEATRVSDGRLIWHRRIRVEEPARERTVDEVVRALGRALGRVFAEVREGLGEAVR